MATPVEVKKSSSFKIYQKLNKSKISIDFNQKMHIYRRKEHILKFCDSLCKFENFYFFDRRTFLNLLRKLWMFIKFDKYDKIMNCSIFFSNSIRLNKRRYF